MKCFIEPHFNTLRCSSFVFVYISCSFVLLFSVSTYLSAMKTRNISTLSVKFVPVYVDQLSSTQEKTLSPRLSYNTIEKYRCTAGGRICRRDACNHYLKNVKEDDVIREHFSSSVDQRVGGNVRWYDGPGRYVVWDYSDIRVPAGSSSTVRSKCGEERQSRIEDGCGEWCLMPKVDANEVKDDWEIHVGSNNGRWAHSEDGISENLVRELLWKTIQLLEIEVAKVQENVENAQEDILSFDGQSPALLDLRGKLTFLKRRLDFKKDLVLGMKEWWSDYDNDL